MNADHDRRPRHPLPFEAPPEAGAAIECAEGMLWMRLPLPMKLDHVNVYALDDGDGWTIVDTGFATAAEPAPLGGASGRAAGQGRPIRRVWSPITTPTTSALPAGSRPSTAPNW
jgi:glyoxylase-like metal-dependent hydrolase (beta-lactamase superfamily II)